MTGRDEGWGSHSLPSSGGKIFLYLLSGIVLI